MQVTKAREGTQVPTTLSSSFVGYLHADASRAPSVRNELSVGTGRSTFPEASTGLGVFGVLLQASGHRQSNATPAANAADPNRLLHLIAADSTASSSRAEGLRSY